MDGEGLFEARAAQPPPPGFYKLYDQGVERGPEPPAPIEGEFQQYGTTYFLAGESGDGGALANDGSSSGSGPGAVAKLRALNRETLFAFIEVVDAMGNRPSESQKAQEILRECLVKMATMLSALRSKQALFEIKKEYIKQNGAGEKTQEFFRELASGLEPLAKEDSPRR
ncbi:subunit 7 mediator of RNA polymerase II transcription [Chloropicon primus]|uniref:Mediator of RNA polymerase II transcription subunit 7 n=1 Tax=Chloropicon primus TaxID=1764295 RepID=A0A5B8MLZ9_9CHLO|nr:hypothetical protein A3770_05p38090 [Chloropicon primus]UPR00505.1 subunit 7 mediator of RNA polymerase II transcription [Chloropicon primus]|mmetsp:Transcript_9000/g.25670  ORF Transcript_9000/g.25670 Transcript_9000/m.25670 type:complete len:169 (+) Transcript_9000:401-907(+)|eukprot:QDZ21291.1 hypothetical protein A3770_05p38090 [Chloropicon primus]